jgi:hypothetical protein
LQKTKEETESLLDDALIRLCADILAYIARIVHISLKKEIGKTGRILFLGCRCLFVVDVCADNKQSAYLRAHSTQPTMNRCRAF